MMKKILSFILAAFMLLSGAVLAEEAKRPRPLPNRACFCGRHGDRAGRGRLRSHHDWLDVTRAGNTAHVGHANVLYQIPEEDNVNPIVYLHGYGQSRMGWMTTPDGREGWATISCATATAPIWSISPGRGEAGAQESMTTDGFLDVWTEDSKEYRPGDQAWYTHFRIGRVAPERYEGSQFPEGDEAAESVLPPDDPQHRRTFDRAKAAAAAMGEVLMPQVEGDAPATKSISDDPSRRAARSVADVPVENIAAIVAIEPGGTRQVGSEQYNRLARQPGIPIADLRGDSHRHRPATTCPPPASGRACARRRAGFRRAL